MKKTLLYISLVPFVFGLYAQNDNLKKFEEADFYNVSNIPTPEGATLEVGGLATMPDGRLAVSTRRGEIWLIENPEVKNDSRPRFIKYAEGLNEILGLAYKDGYLYCVQRGELTKLIDSNKDGRADIYETVVSWPLSGNYHEYGFGPKVDKDGNFIISLNVGFNGDKGKWYEATSKQQFGGWLLKISPDGKIMPWSAGHRSPCGVFVHPITNEYFYTDNQGDWMGSGGLTHCEKGDFVGNPAGLVWTTHPDSPLKLTHSDFCKIIGMCTDDPSRGVDVAMWDIPDTASSIVEAKKRLPQLKTQAVVLPHSIMGQSTSDVIYLHEGNKFAPHFVGQLIVGDQYASKIMRVDLEKVKGVYQGVAFDLRKDFSSGVLRFAWANDGSLFVGMTNRGWGSIGKQPWGLQRVVWTQKTPFEMKTIKAMPDGFEIEFLQAVNKDQASDPAAYSVTSFTYKYHSRYGSPIINDTICPVKAAVVSEDGKKVRLVVDLLREGYVHEIKVNDVASADNVELLHNAGYYTLNKIPDGEKVKLTAAMMHKQHTVKKAEEKPKAVAQPVAKKPLPAVAKAAPAANTYGGKCVTSMPVAWGGNADKTVNLATRPGLMFDQAKVTVKAGSKIKLTFNNNDDMQHNVVITKPGKADAVGETATNMGLEGPKMQYVPKTDDVLFHTVLVSPGTTASIYFEAPKTPGRYQIVCTYPGHYATMQAVFEVQ